MYAHLNLSPLMTYFCTLTLQYSYSQVWYTQPPRVLFDTLTIVTPCKSGTGHKNQGEMGGLSSSQITTAHTRRPTYIGIHHVSNGSLSITAGYFTMHGNFISSLCLNFCIFYFYLLFSLVKPSKFKFSLYSYR